MCNCSKEDLRLYGMSALCDECMVEWIACCVAWPGNGADEDENDRWERPRKPAAKEEGQLALFESYPQPA